MRQRFYSTIYKQLSGPGAVEKASAKAETNGAHLEDLQDKHERTHDVDKSAIAKAHQLEADADH
jgi:hypothetical protein